MARLKGHPGLYPADIPLEKLDTFRMAANIESGAQAAVVGPIKRGKAYIVNITLISGRVLRTAESTRFQCIREGTCGRITVKAGNLRIGDGLLTINPACQDPVASIHYEADLQPVYEFLRYCAAETCELFDMNGLPLTVRPQIYE